MRIDVKINNFLSLIAFSEGTSTSPLTKNIGYDVIVSGIHGPSIFTDYADHPFANGRPPVQVRAGLTSTAAGRYQILARYFEVYKKQLNLPDFSPDSQDAVAIQMIKECKAVDMLEEGNIAGAIKACSSRWASFPFNNYQQGGHSSLELLAEYNAITDHQGLTLA